MEFEECEVSGHMRASGEKGEYWVMEEAWTYLERINPTPAGPKVEQLGTFNTPAEAMEAAEGFDKEVEE